MGRSDDSWLATYSIRQQESWMLESMLRTKNRELVVHGKAATGSKPVVPKGWDAMNGHLLPSLQTEAAVDQEESGKKWTRKCSCTQMIHRDRRDSSTSGALVMLSFGRQNEK